MPLRAHSDAGLPLVAMDPDDPASQAIRHAARGLVAMAPAAPIALPVLDVVQAGPPQPVGMSAFPWPSRDHGTLSSGGGVRP